MNLRVKNFFAGLFASLFFFSGAVQASEFTNQQILDNMDQLVVAAGFSFEYGDEYGYTTRSISTRLLAVFASGIIEAMTNLGMTKSDKRVNRASLKEVKNIFENLNFEFDEKIYICEAWKNPLFQTIILQKLGIYP